MLTFPLELKAGVVTVTNTAAQLKTLNVYVPNKDSIPVTVPAGETVTVTTLSAGESLCYLLQADEKMTVKLADAAG